MARYFSNFFFGSLPSRLLALSLAFSLAFLIACEKPPAELVEAPAETGTIKVIGRLLDAKGEPPILGHAHLARLADAEPVETVEVDGDGWFRLDVPRDGLWMILGSAVHHQMVGVPLVTVGDGPELDLELRLAPNELVEPLEEVRILGDWNGFSHPDADTMERRADGTFVYVVEEAAEPVKYQLLGATVNGRTVNGTGSDAYLFDGSGDYRSIENADEGSEDDQVKIVFDPSKIPASSGKLPKLEATVTLERAFELDATIGRVVTELYQHRQADPAKVWDGGRDVVLEILDDGSAPPELRQLAAVRLLQAPPKAWDPEHRARALDVLPTDSPFWSLASWAVSNLDAARHRDILEALREQNPDDEVKAAAWAAFVREARGAADEARWNEYHAELAEFKDVSPRTRFLVDDLRPDRRIQIGKFVPAFEMTRLDGTRITDQSLRGTMYLLDFWATWCAPCIEEMPEIHEAWKRWGNDRFRIISVSFDQSVEDVHEFRASEWPMPWPQVYLADGFSDDVAQSFEIEALPKPVLVGPDGVIMGTAEDLRGADLLITLEALFGS